MKVVARGINQKYHSKNIFDITRNQIEKFHLF